MKQQNAPDLMTLDQLARQVAGALAVGYRGPANGQVSAIPSRRTIRYYTTLGILDRPVEMRGRTALYGPRHLLQLVAIKRLQEQGLSLVAVQERLTGMTEGQLRDCAGIDLSALAPAGDSAVAAARDAVFWRAAPAAPQPAPAFPESAVADDETIEAAPLAEHIQPTDREGAPGATFDMTARTVQQVALGMGVTLTLPACQPLLDADLAAIRAAADELLVTLRERQLTEGDHR